MTIDEKLAKLEEITKRLESKEIPLEEALALFEQGISLATTIKEELDRAKTKVTQVIEKAKGAFSLADFDLSP